MKQYEAYKETGVKWIPVIPHNWSEIRFKYALSMITTKSTSDVKIGLENIESYSAKYIPTDSVYEGNGIETKQGDILYGKLRPYLAKVLLADCDYNAVGDFYVFRSNESRCKAKYAKWLMLSDGFTKMCSASTYGAKMPRVSSDFINSLYIPLPPLAEQEKIVSYLESKTLCIDAYVAERERELRLLNKLKESEIASVITRGLNPDVKMKDSQNSLFGSIPVHWEERKIKYCFTERSEKNHPDEPILCATQSQGVIPQSLYQNRVVVVNKGFEGLKFVKVGDFVISLRSFEGGIEYAYYQGIISAAYTILTPNNVECADYFKLLFKSTPFIQVLQTCVTGIREGQNINYQMLGRKYIPVPPPEEQKAIVAYIEDKCNKVNSLIGELEAEIEYLKEYKQKLIADCVTGQIDVRNI